MIVSQAIIIEKAKEEFQSATGGRVYVYATTIKYEEVMKFGR